MGVADGEDYPTVYKDAVIKIYDVENNLVQTLITDIYGEAETHIVAAGTYRVTIEHPHRQTMDFSVVAPIANYHLFFNLANEPYQQSFTTAHETMTLTEAAALATIFGAETLVLTPDVINGVKVTEAMSLDEPDVSVAATVWLLHVTKAFNDGNLTQGAINPDEGANQINTANLTATATTKQYSVVQHIVVDGVTTRTNSQTCEKINTAYTTEFEGVPFGVLHLLQAHFRAAWELIVSGTTDDGTFEIVEGQASKTFSIPNPGSPAICHSHYSGDPPVFQGYHYAFCQWDLDGNHYATGTSCSIPAKTKGTSHTLTCYWSCEGLT